MTRRVVLPLLAAATTLATLATIGPVFSGMSWIAGPLVAVAVVVLIGIGLRGPAVAASYVTLLQLALGLLAILVFYVPSSMLAYVIPTPAALSDLIDLIADGAATARATPAPIAPNPGTSSLLALLAVPVAVIVDDCVANRRPALIGIPLLSMFAICSAIVRQPAPLWLAMLPLIGYVLILLVDQLTEHRRAVRWDTAAPGLAVAACLTAVAIGIGATVSTAASLTDGGFLNTSTGHERSTNDMVARTTDLSGQLNRDEPLDLFKVVTDDPSPFYLRAVVLDTWGKDGWSFATPRGSGAQVSDLPETPLPAAKAISTSTIEVQEYGDLFVPTYYAAQSLNLEGDFAYDISMQVVFGEEKGVLEGESYQVVSEIPRPTAAELQAASFGDVPATAAARDLAIPGDVDDSVVELTEQVITGASSPWDVAVALDSFFSDPNGGWTYSLNVPDPEGMDPLASFLAKRSGYCEQYASAMAGMFRIAGVPARVVVGYTNGEQQEDLSYQITTDDAHAWVEAYFGGVGWVAFDPTPIGTRAVPLPYVPSDQVTNEPASPTTEPDAAASATVAPPTEQVDDPATEAQDETSGGSSGIWSVARWVLIAVIAGGVVLLPSAVRAARLRSRLSVAAEGGVGGASAAWDELRDYARDLGLPARRTDTVRDEEARWADEFELQPGAVRRLREAAERGRYDASPRIGPVDDGLREARTQMSESVSAGQRLRARMFPASVLRRDR